PGTVPRTSDSPQVASTPAVSSPDAMRPRQIIGWLTPLAAVALVLGSGPTQTPAAVCVMVTPGIDLGDREEQGAPAGGDPPASSPPAGAPTEPEPTRRNSTVVRYDPRR